MCAKNGKHKEHNTATVQELENTVHINFADSIKKLEDEIETAKCVPESVKINLVKDKEKAAAQIKEEFKRIIEEAEKRRDALLQRLDEMESEKIDEITKISTDAAKALEKAKNVLQKSTDIKTGENSLYKGSKLCEMTDVMLKAKESSKEIESSNKTINSMEGMPSTQKFVTDGNKFIEDVKRLGDGIVSVEFKEVPSNFHTTSINVRSISLAWDELKGAEGYIVGMKESKNNKYDTVYKGQENKCEVSFIKAGTSYDFQIQGVNENFVSKPTELKGVTTQKATVVDTVRELKKCVNNEQSCSALLDELSVLTDASKENRVTAGKEGAIEIVVKILKMYMKSDDMCNKGCLAIWNIIFNNCK